MIESIIDIVADTFDIPKSKLLSRSRVYRIVLARQVAIYFIRDITKISFPKISKIFNNNYSTCSYSYHEIISRIEIGDDVNISIKLIRTKLQQKFIV